MPPPVLHTVPVSQPSKPHETQSGYDGEGPGTIEYARIEVLKPGDDGDARVE